LENFWKVSVNDLIEYFTQKYECQECHLQPEQAKAIKALAQRKTNEVRSSFSSIVFALRNGKELLIFAIRTSGFVDLKLL